MDMHVSSKIPLLHREQPDSLQSHLLVPVSLNEQGPFQFAIEVSRSKTLVSARTMEHLGFRFELGMKPEERPRGLAVSDKTEFPLVRLTSICVGDAVVRDFEVVVWGAPIIDDEMLKTMQPNRFYPMGPHPPTPIDSVLECRGVLGADFMRHFRFSFDLQAGVLVLER